MRKDSGFEVMDHIKVYISGNDRIAAVVEKNEKSIGEKVLADAFAYTAGGTHTKDWNVNGENVTIGVEKLQYKSSRLQIGGCGKSYNIR